MNFYKLLKFDIKYGIFKYYYKYFIYIIFVILSFLYFRSLMISYEQSNFSFMDALIYIMGGEKEYIPIMGETFKLPYIWIIHHILVLFFILNYTTSDLESFGQQIIIHSGSRKKWWMSKCVWLLLSIILYYVILWFGIAFCILATSGNFSDKVSSFMKYILVVGPKALPAFDLNLYINIFAMPIIFTISIGLLQMALCLFIKPVFSYIITVSLCIASAYSINPLLIGNYAMVVRSNQIVSNGVDLCIGVIILATLAMISFIVGLYKIKIYDILKRGQ